MIKAARQSEENFAKEKEQAKARDEQLQSVRQTNRSSLNYFTPANSTPIRSDNTRPETQGVHFNTNPTRHVYSTTSDDNHHYKPPENDSIIQTATIPQTDQPTMNTTRTTNHNTPWRHINNMGTTISTATHRPANVLTSRNDLRKSTSPNSSDNRDGPICFRCGVQGHKKVQL